MLDISNLPTHIYWFGGTLGVLTAAFVLFFLIPAAIVFVRIRDVGKQLSHLQDKNKDTLDRVFQARGVLEHLWKEFYETLHKQTEIDPADGQGRITRLRSTTPAEVFFKPETIVNIPLRTDFFKHLPGVFTGVGIIGTFYGLLLGLSSFRISQDAAVVGESLNALLHGVWEAFIVSASAIALAMLITVIEKLVVTALNARVEKLVQDLDGLFEAGAGEEYLARLVKSSESSASQTAILKDALVGDLKEILHELTERQIAASAANSAALGDRIGSSLEAGLKAPLNEIAEAFKGVRSDQGTAVQSMLTDVLTAFSQQLKELFGDQIAGINTLQQQTIEALKAAVVKLEQMASNMDSAGQKGATAMADQLREAMAAAEGRQKVMNEKMSEFVEQIRLSLKSADEETSAALQGTLSSLSAQMEKVAQSLSEQVVSTAAATKKHQGELAAESKQVMGDLSENVTILIAGISEATKEMKSAVMSLSATTNDAVTKMNSGADTLYIASSDFAKAGQGVTGALDKSTALVGQLTQAAGSVASASTSLGGVLTDYRAARDSMASLVETLERTIENARRDAAVSQDLIARMEGAASKLTDAQRQAEDFLAKVAEVIGESHGEFTQGMTRAVSEANREFHRALSDSVKLLREGIQELEATFDNVTPRRKAG